MSAPASTLPIAAFRGVLRLRRLNWFHPEWWAAALAASAWAFLLALTARDLALRGLSGPDHGLAAASGRGVTALLAAWAVMAVAMMVPLVLGSLRHVALGSLWRRRHRSEILFLAGYLAVWMVAGAVIVTAVVAVAGWAGATAASSAAFAAAAVWQLTPVKRRSLRRCRYTSPLAPTGWRADRDCATFGARIGWSCVTTCWALMAAAAAAAHTFEVMVALFAVQLHERFRRRPSPAAGAAVAVALGILLPVAELVVHG